MNTNFKLSIGMGNDAAPDPNNYARMNLDFELHKEKIHEMTNQLRAKTGKYRVPMLIFDFPASAKNTQHDMFRSSSDMQFSEVTKNGRVYKCLDMIDKELIGNRKKIEKIFGKLTELDNQLFLHVDFYNVDSYHGRLKVKDQYPIAVFFEKAKIQGKLGLDPEFFEVFSELARKVSPKFADSPLIAVLPLLNMLQCEIDMDSLSDLEQENQKELFGFKSYEEPDDDQQGKKVLQDFKNNDKMYIYVTIDSLGVLKVQMEVRMFAYYSCLI